MGFLRAVQTGMKNEHGLHGGNSRRNIANVAPIQKGDTTLRMTNPNIKSFTSQMQQVTNATVINAEFQTCSAANPILDILMRPYWRRAWVLQEFAVARDAFFVCGSQIMHWQELYEAIQTIVGCYERSPEDWLSIEPLWLPVLRMFFVRNHFHNCPSNLLLGHLLIETSTATQYLNATDPRDKIFSLLGLSCDATDLSIQAYYDTSWQKVYEDVAKKLLLCGQLEILSCCRLSIRPFWKFIPQGYIPSWVPDWTTDSQFPLQGLSVSTSRVKYSASSHMKSEPRFYSSPRHSVLVLPAVCVDVIQKTSSPWVTLANNNLHDYKRWLLEIHSLSPKGRNVYGKGRPWLEAAWRTPVADTMLDCSRPRRAFATDIFQYQAICVDSPRWWKLPKGGSAQRMGWSADYRRAMNLVGVRPLPGT
jgi:hypothetical protein